MDIDEVAHEQSSLIEILRMKLHTESLTREMPNTNITPSTRKRLRVDMPVNPIRNLINVEHYTKKRQYLGLVSKVELHILKFRDRTRQSDINGIIIPPRSLAYHANVLAQRDNMSTGSKGDQRD